jgi:hypothetical protein
MSLLFEHARVATRSGTAALRDLEARDIATIVAYWHDGGADFFTMSVDVAKLGTPDDTRKRFEASLRTGDPNQQRMGFAIDLNGKMVGYSVLSQHSAETNYSHWHIVEKTKRVAGISTALYPHRMKAYFNNSPIARLIHQTSVRNQGVNQMLDKYVPVAETRWVEKLDGAGAPGNYHLRYVHRADVPRLFARATELAQQ